LIDDVRGEVSERVGRMPANYGVNLVAVGTAAMVEDCSFFGTPLAEI